MLRKLSILLVLLVLLAVALALVYFYVGARAVDAYGPPAQDLDLWQRFTYSATLLWYDGLVDDAANPDGLTQTFTVDQGELASSVATRLQDAGLIRSAAAFRTYLIYSGFDKSLQAGDYDLSPAMSALEIGLKMQDATPADVTFNVLAGWRMEEVAASLPTSGLSISPAAFIQAASDPRLSVDFLPGSAGAEGFLFPSGYVLPRGIPARELVRLMVENAALYLDPDLRAGFARQGLTVFQAVTLASIVQREAVLDDEKPLIASVFLNRLQAGMELQSDATVQYALGYDASGRTWWTNPLSAADLKVESPYNTYANTGLPPGPIDNPDLTTLQAVAYPADTPYYYFRARCDGSGGHSFAETFEQHMQNACP